MTPLPAETPAAQVQRLDAAIIALGQSRKAAEGPLLFCSRAWANARWAIFDLTGSDHDFDEFLMAARAAAVDPDEYLERAAA